MEKKKLSVFGIVLSCVIVMLFMSGCSSIVTDDDVKTGVEAGLNARWDYQANPDANLLYLECTVDSLTEYYTESINKELGEIIKFKDAEFESADLGKAMNEYIDCLEKQQNLLSKGIEDYWTLEYNLKAYQWYRHEALKEIDRICKLEFTGEYKENFKDVIGEKYYENMNDNPKQVEEAFTIEESRVDNQFSLFAPRIKVKNNTDFTYPTYALVYRIKAKDGTIIEAESFDYINNFPAGSEAWTTYNNCYELKEGYTYEVYGYAASEEEGYISNTIKLPKSIEIKISK